MNFCLQSYIDPVNGNALRSIRDVHRYLTSGKVSRLAHKSRSQRNSSIEFQHDEISVSVLKVLEVENDYESVHQLVQLSLDKISVILWSDAPYPFYLSKEEPFLLMMQSNISSVSMAEIWVNSFSLKYVHKFWSVITDPN